MSYVALYRKFRPSTFEEVKGQDHIVKTLKNQMKADRIGHAYLFCGTRGTGKTSVAKILAKAVNCEHPVDGSPCGVCPSCQAISAGASMNVIEIDAASNNGVDSVREIREEVAYRPTQGRYKVYIIDEVHMLSVAAFNALLKTLEEPPSYVIFILATTEANKIPITILSRCQRYNFHRISMETVAARLRELLDAEGVEAEDRALAYVAKAGDGSMRDALSLLDQCISFYYGEKLTYEKALEVLGASDYETFSRMLRQVIAGDVSACIRHLEEIIYHGKELTQFVGDFTWYLRNLLLLCSGDGADAIDVSEENLRLMMEECELVDEATLMRYIRILSELTEKIRYAAQKRVIVETALIRMCRPQMEIDLTSLQSRIRQLEEKLEKGEFQVAAPSTLKAQVSAPVKEDKPLPPPAKATPEDLRRVCERWTEILRGCGGRLRSILANTRPQYNSDTGESILYLKIDTPNGGLGLSEKALVELKDVILEMTNLQIDVKTVDTKGPTSSLRDLDIKRTLNEQIAVPIEVADAPDE